MALVIQRGGRVFLEQVCKSIHVAERRAQVVRDGVAERFQLLVSRLELRV